MLPSGHVNLAKRCQALQSLWSCVGRHLIQGWAYAEARHLLGGSFSVEFCSRWRAWPAFGWMPTHGCRCPTTTTTRSIAPSTYCPNLSIMVATPLLSGVCT
mmetsp:Transcript_34670/g.80913  ORF Transcript_34670/g.80913 Transcript_34670/m.80913 type:complete len:101 (+) Transcript_34670:44-346(+)